MVLIFVIIAVLLGYWLLPPAVKAVDATLSTKSLSEQLREGRVEIVKLFEQHLPGAAEEKFKVLCEKAETHCKQKDIQPHEYPTLFPELLVFLEFYFDTEAKYRMWSGTAEQNAAPTPGVVSTPMESSKRTEPGAGFDRQPFTGYVKPEPVVSTYSAGYKLPDPKSSVFPAQNSGKPLGTSNNVSAGQVTSSPDVPLKASAPTVKLCPSKKSGHIINNYKDSENAYANVVSEEIIVRGSRVFVQKRSALIKGSRVLIERLIKAIQLPNGDLPGKIRIMEFAESDVPENVANEFIRDDIDYEDAIAPYVKRSGTDGIKLLTEDGERILRFQSYVMQPTEKHQDIFVEHVNEADVQVGQEGVNLQRNLEAVPLHDNFADKTCNPIYLAFKMEHEITRFEVGVFFVILVKKLNLKERKESLMWLKTALFSLDVSQYDAIEKALQLIPILEKRSSVSQPTFSATEVNAWPVGAGVFRALTFFSRLDLMDERQKLLFTWLVYNTAQHMPQPSEGLASSAFSKVMLFLPMDLVMSINSPGPSAEFMQEVNAVLVEIQQEAL